MSGFTPAQRRKIMDRDVHCIPHSGTCGGPLVIHHRRNRGIGGDPTADVVSNGLVVCDGFNTAMEQSAGLAEHARTRGWKLRSYMDPHEALVFIPELDRYVTLDDHGSYLVAGEPVTVLRV